MLHGLSDNISSNMFNKLYTCLYDSRDMEATEVSYIQSLFSWDGAMGHRPISQKNGPLTTEIAILNLERMAH